MSLHQLKSSCNVRDILLLGVVRPQPDPTYSAFRQWLKAGKHGAMSYLENYPEMRHNPALLEPAMPRVIVCAYPYGSKTSYRKSSAPPPTPRVAQYARLKDYHRYLKKVGAAMMDSYLRDAYGSSHTHSYRVVVDSAPILEKSLAAQTGAGFIGKNTLFIRPNHGSFLFLFEIYTTALLPPTHEAQQRPDESSPPPAHSCGSCRRCQVHCPTGALDQAYTLDATKCLAYYTIEHRGLIPVQYWPHLREYYFGCDICQLVCPHNRHAQAAHGLKQVIPTELDLAELACMDHATYVKIFAGTPMTRAKRLGLRRNALIAMHVSNHPHQAKVHTFIMAENTPLLVQTLHQRHDYDTWQRQE